jgi:hypothetical protein
MPTYDDTKFGISFIDKGGNEHYGTVYRSMEPDPLYAVHFYEDTLVDEYSVLILGVVDNKFIHDGKGVPESMERFVTLEGTSIPNIRQLCIDKIKEYLHENKLSIT